MSSYLKEKAGIQLFLNQFTEFVEAAERREPLPFYRALKAEVKRFLELLPGIKETKELQRQLKRLKIAIEREIPIGLSHPQFDKHIAEIQALEDRLHRLEPEKRSPLELIARASRAEVIANFQQLAAVLGRKKQMFNGILRDVETLRISLCGRFFQPSIKPRDEKKIVNGFKLISRVIEDKMRLSAENEVISWNPQK